MARHDPDITVTKVYFPREDPIQIHLNRVCPCPSAFPAGYYWYGGKRKGPGRPPRWVDEFLSDQTSPDNSESTVDHDNETSPSETDESKEADYPEGEDEADSSAGESEAESTQPGADQQVRKSGRFHLRERVLPPQRYM